MKYLQIILCLICFSSPILAQRDTTVKFKVLGVCGMCKQRIERGLLGKGVKYASWDVESKILTVIYKPQKVSLQAIHERAAAVGHDTELVKAEDKVYAKLHDCCKYREQ